MGWAAYAAVRDVREELAGLPYKARDRACEMLARRVEGFVPPPVEEGEHARAGAIMTGLLPYQGKMQKFRTMAPMPRR